MGTLSVIIKQLLKQTKTKGVSCYYICQTSTECVMDKERDGWTDNIEVIPVITVYILNKACIQKQFHIIMSVLKET